jgi:hypothetical protein
VEGRKVAEVDAPALAAAFDAAVQHDPGTEWSTASSSRRRRLRPVTLLICLALFVAACEGGSETSVSDAASELKAAVDRTLEADSFHIELSSEASDADGKASIDYNAPDRMRTVSEDGSESIVVGNTLYFGDVERPDHFLSPKRADAAPDNLLIFLRVIRDAECESATGTSCISDCNRALARNGPMPRTSSLASVRPTRSRPRRPTRFPKRR